MCRIYEGHIPGEPEKDYLERQRLIIEQESRWINASVHSDKPVATTPTNNYPEGWDARGKDQIDAESAYINVRRR